MRARKFTGNTISIIIMASGVSFSVQTSAAPAEDITAEALVLFDKKADDQKIFTFDYGIPSSPALTLAGLPTDTTSTSTSLKPFVFSLPGLLNSNSSQNTAALDTAPAWIFGGAKHPKLYAAADNYFGRLGYRTRLGAALYKGDSGGGDASKAKTSRAAFGVSTSLVDESDPLATRGANNTVWQMCLDAHKAVFKTFVESSLETQKWEPLDAEFILLANRPPAQTPAAMTALIAAMTALIMRAQTDGISLAAADNLPSDQLDQRFTAYRDEVHKRTQDAEAKDNSSAAQAERDKLAQDAVEACKKQASEAAQHGADLDLGFGGVWRGEAGKLQNFKDPNFAGWIAGRFSLNSFTRDFAPCEGDANTKTSELACWMIGGSGRYSGNEFVSTGDKSTPEIKADVFNAWATIERVDSRFKVAFAYGYLDQKAVKSDDEKFSKSGWRYLATVGVSLDMIVKGLWLEASYGSARGTVDTLNDHLALLTFTFAPPEVPSLTGGK